MVNGLTGRTEGTLRGRIPIENRLSRIHLRLVVRIALRHLALAVPSLAVVWTALLLPSRFSTVPAPPWILLPVVLLLVLAATAILAIRRSPRRAEVPLLLDRILGTSELLTAAVEAGPGCTHPLGYEARVRASRVIGGLDARKVLPLTRWGNWWMTAAASGVLAAAALIPLHGGAVAVSEEEQAALERVREGLAPAVRELERQAESMDSEELTAALQELQSLSADLERGRITDREQALLALDRVDRLVERHGGRDNSIHGGSELDAAFEELALNPFTEGLAKAMDSGDMQRLHDAVLSAAEALTSSEMREEERKRHADDLAGTLEQLAEALREAGLEEEAERLEAIASALRSGRMEQARRLLESALATRACGALLSAKLGEGVAQELVETLNMARYLLGGGKPMPLETACEGGGKQGSGLRSPLPGTESTNREGERFESGDPMIRDRQTGEGSSRRERYEALYDAHIIEAESWVDVQARSGPGADGAFISETGRSAGVGKDVRGSLQFYATAAPGAPERAAELERVPLGYRDVVRRYFSKTEEETGNEGDEGE